jgi:hypothetical protein
MTATLPAGPLAEALARNRATFNARFAAARAAGGRIDGPAFLEHLAAVVEPLVRGAAACHPERVDAVTSALYQNSLELFAVGLAGPQSRCPEVAEAWRTLLAAAPKLLAREPERLAASVSNAVYTLAGIGGARPQEWVARMTRLAPQCQSVGELLECGRVAAWLAGVPAYRAAALETAGRLPPRLAVGALGLPSGLPPDAVAQALELLARDPWSGPADVTASPTRLGIVKQVGAFRGFGGSFVRPPLVRAAQGELHVSDGAGHWRLLADRHGAMLVRLPTSSASANAARQPSIDRDGSVRWGDRHAAFAMLANSTSHAADAHTLAVTIPTSHHVFLVAPVAGD